MAQVHNNQRDGMHRQTINRGRVSYEPNSLGGGCPFQAGAAGFVSYREPMPQGPDKVRGKAERFAEHYAQARLFWNSQTPIEQHHIVNAFRFELSRVQTPAIRERMVSGLMNVDTRLAQSVAKGLGMRALPEPMPKVLKKDITPEVTTSPALSLSARPGNGAVAGRRVAILVADGVNTAAVKTIQQGLAAVGAVPRLVGSRLGPIDADSGTLEVDTTVEAMPSVLFDAVVIPGAADANATLAGDGRAVEFVKDQYRHCKPILILGAGTSLLDAAGVPPTLASGAADPGLVRREEGDADAVEAFITALTRHRHFERETDPPMV